MNEQTIFLIFLVSALAVTLGLYFLKAKKQMQYKGDERWKLIQLNANNAANISNTVLIVLIVVLPLLIDSQTTFTLQRVVTFVLIYIGIRNLIELVATIYKEGTGCLRTKIFCAESFWRYCYFAQHIWYIRL